jgi:multicomponent Na+:H+ antiporter subunit E
MSALLWNVLLAVAWTAVTGELSPANLALGFALGFVILAATRQAIGVPHYPTKLRCCSSSSGNSCSRTRA